MRLNLAYVRNLFKLSIFVRPENGVCKIMTKFHGGGVPIDALYG